MTIDINHKSSKKSLLVRVNERKSKHVIKPRSLGKDKNSVNVEEAGEHTLSESFIVETSQFSPIKPYGERTDLINLKTDGAFGF